MKVEPPAVRFHFITGRVDRLQSKLGANTEADGCTVTETGTEIGIDDDDGIGTDSATRGRP